MRQSTVDGADASDLEVLIPTRSSRARFVLFRYGGCGIVPSGAFHLELPTTVPNREVEASDVVLWDRAGAVRPPVP